MKKDYIKLYVDNVVYRLPQKDRDEVRKELYSNIYDMLPENPNEAEIKKVLEDLGDPKKLAEEYRSNPRYLISPAIFDNYIKVLIIGVPLIALILAFVGFMIALVGVITNNIIEISEIMSEIIGGFISSLYSGAFYSAVFITLGFVVYEHANKAIEKEKQKIWRVEELNEVYTNTESSKGIPLTGSVASIVVTVCLSVLFILIAVGVMPSYIWIKHNNLEVYNFFSKEFLQYWVHLIPILAAAVIFTNILKIKYRKWTKIVLYSTIATDIVYMASFIFLFTRTKILSVEFIGFLRSLPVESTAVIDSLVSGRAIAIVVISIVVITCFISIGHSAYKLLKMDKENNKILN